MGYKKMLLVVTPLLFILAGVIYSERLFTTLGALIFSFSLAFGFSLFVLYFLREEIFHSWLRFIKWYFPLAGIAIYLSFGSRGGWGIGNIFATELVTMWTAGLFFLSSLIIIIYKTIYIRRKEKLLRTGA